MPNEDDITSLQGPVEEINGKLMLRIPLDVGGDRLQEASRGISSIDGNFLCVAIPDWLADDLRLTAGSLVSVDNRSGKFNIHVLNSDPTQ